MTVAELIEKLSLFDHRLPVLTPGFDDITVKVCRMAEYRKLHTVWTMLPEVDLYSDDRPNAGSVFDAVVISFD